MKKISIITPSLNQGAYIRETIESVLSQSDPCFEHIVVDGGSTDNTLSVLKEYPHLRWISEPDKGQSDAVNKGLAMCSGEIVAEINADDYYLPGAFAKVRDVMEKPGAKEVCVGGCDYVRNGRLTMTWRMSKVDLQAALRFPCSPIPQASLFMTTSIFRSIGGVDTRIVYGADIVQFIKLAQITDFDVVRESIAVNRSHDGSMQEMHWDKNFTAVLYHIARYGDFENFHEMYCYTHDRFRHSRDADLVIPLMLAYAKNLWRALGQPKPSGAKPRVAVFGAGCHTAWLANAVEGTAGPDVVAVIDDQADIPTKYWGLSVCLPQDASMEDVDAIVVSTDTFFAEMSARCRELFGDTIPLVDLYEGLPAGPYRK